MQNEKIEIETAGNTFTKKIGRINYTVKIYFNKASKETFQDKLLRLIKNDLSNKKSEELHNVKH